MHRAFSMLYVSQCLHESIHVPKGVYMHLPGNSAHITSRICHSLTAPCKSISPKFLFWCAQEGLVLQVRMQEPNRSLGRMTGQRECRDACRCGKGVDCEEHEYFLVQAILTQKRLIFSTVAFSLLPPPSMESFNHIGAVKFQP